MQLSINPSLSLSSNMKMNSIQNSIGIPQSKSSRKINIYDDQENYLLQERLMKINKNKEDGDLKVQGRKDSEIGKVIINVKALDNQPIQPRVQAKVQTKVVSEEKIIRQSNKQIIKQQKKQFEQKNQNKQQNKQQKMSQAFDPEQRKQRQGSILKNAKVHKVKIVQKPSFSKQPQNQNEQPNCEPQKNQITQHVRQPSCQKVRQGIVKVPSQKNSPFESQGSLIARSLRSIISNNQSQNQNQDFDRISRKTKDTFRSTRSSCEDYLGHVFDYYCKMGYAVGKSPTFDQIQQKIKIMTITNFMIFCKDFRIRENVERQKLVQIFKKKSSFQKHLNPEQFHECVQQIAQIIFKDFQQQRRFGRMLVFLEIHNSFSFVRKMNKLGVTFRLKNKRGIDVNLSPKYQFKLTPNNGKDQRQIAIEVKERSKLREILKKQQIQWHKKNKLNKIDQLYKNGVKKKMQSVHKKNNNIQNQAIKLASNRSKLKNQLNQLQLNTQKQQNKQKSGRNSHGYYNPCQILTQRSENSDPNTTTYKKIHQLKKKILQKQSSDRIFRQNSQIGTYNKYQYQNYNSASSNLNLNSNQNQNQNQNQRVLKVNDVISMAKNSIKMGQFNQDKLQLYSKINDSSRVRQYGIIKKQNNIPHQQQTMPYSIANNDNILANSELVKSRYLPIGCIIPNKPKVLASCPSQSPSPSSAVSYYHRGAPMIKKYNARISKQLRHAQSQLCQQLSKIPTSTAQHKDRAFLRATALVDKQNTKQIRELQEMLGIGKGGKAKPEGQDLGQGEQGTGMEWEEEDQILRKHLQMENKYDMSIN